MLLTPVLEKVVSEMSVTPLCPRCKEVIASEDVNVAKDIAFCRHCGLAHSLSALANGTAVNEDVDESRPPAGVWFHRDGGGTVIGATHRSLGQAFGLLFFTVFWNGIVSVFVLMAVASTLRHIGIPLPGWFPVPKGSAIPVGMTLFLWIFLTPFIAVGLFTLGAFFSSLFGRTELRIQGGEGTLFTGIGPIGFNKRFSTGDVKDVRIEDRTWRDSNGSHRRAQIIIDMKQKAVAFGSMFSSERRQFVAGAAKRELIHA
jgi:hypothetical protein